MEKEERVFESLRAPRAFLPRDSPIGLSFGAREGDVGRRARVCYPYCREKNVSASCSQKSCFLKTARPTRTPRTRPLSLPLNLSTSRRLQHQLERKEDRHPKDRHFGPFPNRLRRGGRAVARAHDRRAHAEDAAR